MTRRTDRKSKMAEVPTARKLTVKKNTLKDLTAPARGQLVKGGAFGTTSSKVVSYSSGA